MKKLIITADDYGLSKPVDEAIDACIAAGTIHATCVMMNMPFFTDMIALKTRFPWASVGIHWNITHGAPILPASQISSLVGTNGQFLPKAELKRRWLLRQLKGHELKAELRAQFERFCDLSGIPAFWCTHQDVHIFPGLFQICVAAGLELGIPAMRCHRRIVVSQNYTPAQYFRRYPAYWLKSKLVEQWSVRAEKMGMRMPDGQIQMRGYEMSLAGMDRFLDRLQFVSPQKIVELTVHPAVEIDESLSKSYLKESRVNEYNVLSDPHFRDSISSRALQLVGYDSLDRNDLQ